ncbi:MAG: 2-C-methyl-D-erythritol 4-phosphate cytidylyltransferase [Bacteroidia bacterium]
MNTVIIVAGGSGSRMQSKTPKQFELLHGKPVIVYSIEKFLSFDPSIQIIVALAPGYAALFSEVQKQFNLTGITVVNGGETRFHSVKNGLEKVNEKATVVAIHDAARPLVSLQTIKNTFSAAISYKAAVPVIEMNESLREVSGQHSKAVDRKNYKVVQTPQCFEKEILLNAYQQNYLSSFTDDATVVEATGQPIHLAEGNVENIKITYPRDLILANSLL